MPKLLATLAGVLLVAQATGQILRPTPTSQRPPTQQEFARQEQLASGVPYQVLFAEKAWAGADVLVPLLSSTDPLIRAAAVTAVGRLEDPRTVPNLMTVADGDSGFAIAEALHGFDPVNDPELLDRLAGRVGLPSAGKIRWATAGQVHGVEQMAVSAAILTRDDPQQAGRYMGALTTLEWLARLNQRVTSFEEPTLKVLTQSVAGTSANDHLPEARKHAFTALVSAGAVDPDSEKFALNDEEWPIRRLAVQVLAGGGASLTDENRFGAIKTALNEHPRSFATKRFAPTRRGVPVAGCQPLLDHINDDDSHVGLAAIDALGDQCKDDQDITTRLVAESLTPDSTNWHRPTHAFVALARRAPDRAAVSMVAFSTHPNWWVRMYAARAAAAMEDVLGLDKLSSDVNDNVREATLEPLRKLKKFDADSAIAATLNSSDVQLLRTAALLLKASPHANYLFRPLIGALMRLTTEDKETSRDARLPLLDAIEVHINTTQWPELRPLLKDFDPKVASRAADLITKLTGKTTVAEPATVTRGSPAEFNHTKDRCVTVDMAFGGSFVMDMIWSAAPITIDRFLRLAVKDHYYDGLTFHRVVPNFVIQGGSPGANEYSGGKEYMRDEISHASNTRGSVGLSTRGRNTGDGQFYVNLVDNPRLDLD